MLNVRSFNQSFYLCFVYVGQNFSLNPVSSAGWWASQITHQESLLPLLLTHCFDYSPVEGLDEHGMLLSVNLTSCSEADLQNMTLSFECVLLLSSSSNLLRFKALLTPRSLITSWSSLSCTSSGLSTERSQAEGWGRRKEGARRRRSLRWSGASAPLQGTGCGFSRCSVICVCAQFALLHITQTHTHHSNRHPLCELSLLPSVDVHIQSSWSEWR